MTPLNIPEVTRDHVRGIVKGTYDTSNRYGIPVWLMVTVQGWRRVYNQIWSSVK